MVEDVGLKELCATRRLKPTAGWLGVLLIALWSPIGILLILLRSTATALACVSLALTPARFRDAGFTIAVRILMALWGFRAHVTSGDAHKLRDAKIIVMNHVSQLDAIPLRAICPLSALIRETYREANGIVRNMAAAGFQPIYVPNPNRIDSDASRRNVRDAVLSRLEVRSPAPPPPATFGGQLVRGCPA